jgi:uncharacterized OsmC-like protein
MNSQQLKALQQPFKDKYKSHPESALVTLHARGNVDVQNLHCHVDAPSGPVRAGLHPAAGGNEADACSAKLLLESLIACAGVTLAAVATNMGIDVRSCQLDAYGDMDFKGTLGVDRSSPVGITAIRLEFRIESDAPSDTIEKLIQLTERYCVIYQTLKSGVGTMSRSVHQHSQSQ